MKIIEIIVSPQGQSTVATKGFTGGECREASKYVEESLGAKLSERLTAEFHQDQEMKQPMHERQS
jgi:hypothetical protein